MAIYTVRIVDGEGNPIEGARVVAVGERLDSQTDQNGEITATLPGYSGGLGVSLIIHAPGGTRLLGTGPLIIEPDVVKEIVL